MSKEGAESWGQLSPTLYPLTYNTVVSTLENFNVFDLPTLVSHLPHPVTVKTSALRSYIL